MQTRSLKCKLTNKQLDERRDKLAEHVEKLRGLESEKKSASAKFKELIERTEIDMVEVAIEIRERAEYRDVEIASEKDFKRGVEEVTRQDTGEIIQTRVLRPDELQGELYQVHPDRQDHLDGEAV